MEDAKHQALVYANELCLADSKCTDPVVGKCARLTAKKVTCKSVLERKGDHRCKYKILLKKTPEGIKGNVGEITCT